MKVKELIEELQKYDPEITVYRHDYGYGPDPIDQVYLEKAIEMNRTFGTQRDDDFLVVR